MTTANFRTRVANYIGRDPSIFVDATSGFDNLLAAINDTRRDAQQMYDWQGLRTPGFMNINGSAGAPWAYPTAASAGYGPYADSGLTTALRLKKIDSVWNYTLDAQGVAQRTNRIDFGTEQQFKHLLPTNTGYPFTQQFPGNPPFYYNTIPSQRMFAYVIGAQFYINTANQVGQAVQSNQFMIVGLQLLPDLLGQETSDFFLDNYQSWCLLQTITNLNGYVKEDQRVQIGAAAVASAWNTATFNDSQQAAMGEWTNLD